MKKIILFPLAAVFAVVALVACNKEETPRCTNNSLTQDRHIIDSFINANPAFDYLTYNSTHNMYHGIEAQGSGSQPAADSQLVFKREIHLMNGTLVDSGTVSRNMAGYPLRLTDFNQQSPDYFVLSGLREGGRAKLLIPSSLNGLGCLDGRGSVANIPANSQLVSTITLIDVIRGQSTTP